MPGSELAIRGLRMERLEQLFASLKNDPALRGNVWPALDSSKLMASKDELVFSMQGESVSLLLDRKENVSVITSKSELMERARSMTNRCLDGIMPFLR